MYIMSLICFNGLYIALTKNMKENIPDDLQSLNTTHKQVPILRRSERQMQLKSEETIL